MIRTLLTIAIFLFAQTAAQPIAADPARVQSGEHPTFSRLVFPDAAGRTWRLTQPTPSRVSIAFSNGVPDLDLDRVFDFIPMDRLQKVEFGRDTLSLTLGCECPVVVSQIPSGHVVIDVQDGPPRIEGPEVMATITAKPERILPTVLPLREIAGPVIAEPTTSLAADVLPSAAIAPRQILFHPLGNGPLTLTESDQPKDDLSIPSCPIEALAAATLQRDPTEALQSLTGQATVLLDGRDVLDADAVTELARHYLAIGWGSEAIQIASMTSADATDLTKIASALDGMRLGDGPAPDPGCGPATAVISLLSQNGPDGWDRADQRRLSIFLDSLPPDRWNDLQGRLSAALASVGALDVLEGLGPQSGQPVDPPKTDQIATGTDVAAVEAAIETLTNALAKDTSASNLYIGNAFALRQSVPIGPLRQRLNDALAETLVVARQPGEAVALVAAGDVQGPDVLTYVLRHLSPFEAAEFAIRLRPHLTKSPAARRQAQALFVDLGLPQIARRFDDDRFGPRPLPIEVNQPASDADPWLARDMAALTAAPSDTWTDRNRLAKAIIDRNTGAPPDTDLAAAEAILAESRSLSILISRLVASP